MRKPPINQVDQKIDVKVSEKIWICCEVTKTLALLLKTVLMYSYPFLYTFIIQSYLNNISLTYGSKRQWFPFFKVTVPLLAYRPISFLYNFLELFSFLIHYYVSRDKVWINSLPPWLYSVRNCHRLFDTYLNFITSFVDSQHQAEAFYF
jgi:hypothetical protein